MKYALEFETEKYKNKNSGGDSELNYNHMLTDAHFGGSEPWFQFPFRSRHESNPSFLQSLFENMVLSDTFGRLKHN